MNPIDTITGSQIVLSPISTRLRRWYFYSTTGREVSVAPQFHLFTLAVVPQWPSLGLVQVPNIKRSLSGYNGLGASLVDGQSRLGRLVPCSATLPQLAIRLRVRSSIASYHSSRHEYVSNTVSWPAQSWWGYFRTPGRMAPLSPG